MRASFSVSILPLSQLETIRASLFMIKRSSF
jgi:hypothetical protein